MYKYTAASIVTGFPSSTSLAEYAYKGKRIERKRESKKKEDKEEVMLHQA